MLLLSFVVVLGAGLLAGVELAFHHGLRGPMLQLDDVALLTLRKALVLRLRVFVPALFIPTALGAIALTVLDGVTALRVVGLGALAVWVALRVVGTVPINSATLEWQTTSPPIDWKQRIARAERFHVVGTWAAVATFICFLVR